MVIPSLSDESFPAVYWVVIICWYTSTHLLTFISYMDVNTVHIFTVQ